MKKPFIITGLLLAGVVLTFSGKAVRIPPISVGESHLVLLKWNSAADAAGIAEMDSLWRKLRQDIEGFDHYQMRPLKEGAFDHVVIMEFENNESHQNYLNSAEHLKLVELGNSVVNDVLAFSY